MHFIRLLPAIISLLILSAHFSRAGFPFISIILLILPLLLIVKRPWVARLIQIVLLFGCVEWIRSLVYYVNQRQELGEPFIRLVLILGIVAILTGLAALVFKNKALKERYKL